MEICVDSLESVRHAIEGGASRLELCAALSEGGLTPTPGLAKLAKSFAKVPVYVMIRARNGDFVYTDQEMDVMLYDLEILKSLDVDGFVFGALTPTGEIDASACSKILRAAQPLPVTFHRAFDEAKRPFVALETLVELGFKRVLTSGQKNTAEEGLGLIEELVRHSNNRIIVMPGSGITEDNLLKIKLKSGAKEFHASAKRKKVRAADSKQVKIGANDDNNFVMVTDREVVESMVNIIKNL